MIKVKSNSKGEKIVSILVTGGCGYIGSHVVRQLSELGLQVIVYDNLSTGSPKALIKGETLIQDNLENTEKLETVFKKYSIDSVLHFAASIIVPESVSNPLKYYANNTSNIINLLGLCTKYEVKNFIFSSTGAVYGFPESGIASEESLTNPINPYGMSKLMSENILKDTAKVNNLNYVILRYFNVAGADCLSRMGQRNPEATHLIKACCQAAVGLREFVKVYGSDYETEDGTCLRDYIHVEDLANAHIKALKYLKDGNQSITLNMGYGKGISVKKVIEATKQITKIDFPVYEVERRAGDPAILISKADKACTALGWKPRYQSLDKIILDAWNWEKKVQAQIIPLGRNYTSLSSSKVLIEQVSSSIK